MSKVEQLIIIGGGSSGLAGAIYASRAMLSPLLFEGEPGGQLMLTSEVENYPGFDESILGPELMRKFKAQALKFGTKFVSEKVQSIKKAKDLIEVVDSKGEKYITKSLLISTGSQAMWLGLPSETRLQGKGVSACATCDGFFFKEKHVVVVGGGDTAMEEASYLTKFASKVTLIHRRDTFKASVFMQNKVKTNSKIEIIYNTVVEEILGQEKVTGVLLNRNGKKEELACDGVFIAIGHSPATSFLKDSEVVLDEKGYIFTTERVRFEKKDTLYSMYPTDYRYQTNIEGVFASGDCVDYIYKQAGTAVGSAIASVLEIEKYLISLEH